MARTPIHRWLSSSSFTLHNVVNFSLFGDRTGGATIANEQTKIRTAGVLSRMAVYITSNSRNGAIVYRLRVNGSNVNQSVSITASTTGVFSDTSNSDTISAGDLLSMFSDNGGSSGTCLMTSGSMEFAATSGTTQFMAWAANVSLSFVNDWRFGLFHGAQVAATDARSEDRFKTGGSMANFFVYVPTNTRTSTVTFACKKNGSTGNLSISVTASSTGAFEDTSGSDTIASGDDYMYSMNIIAGSNAIAVSCMKVEWSPTSDLSSHLGSHALVASPINFTQAGTFEPLSGKIGQATVEAEHGYIFRSAFLLTNLQIYVSANTTETGTARMRKNAGNGNMAISIGSGVTGYLEDSSNTDSVVAGDRANYHRIKTGTNTLQAYYMSVRLVPVDATTVDDDRAAEVHGQATTNSARGAEIAGKNFPTLTAVQSGIDIELEWTYTP